MENSPLHCKATYHVPYEIIMQANSKACVHESQNHRITESQNGRGWKGPLWIIWSNPTAEAGLPTAGCTGPCPGRVSISPEKEN